MATSTKLKVLPAGHRIIETAHGNYIQKQKQRRSTYKTPKATRQKIAAAARRVKIPILTGGALVIGVVPPVQLMFKGAWRSGGAALVMNYTGFNPIDGSFRFRRMGKGLFPLLAVMIVNKTGILKPVNQKLASIRGNPLRLN